MPDIFISYAHKDDLSPCYQTRGWVAWFYEQLRDRMLAVRPGSTDIFLDRSPEGITGTSLLTPTLRKALEETRVLLIVSSPAYFDSSWCREELDVFCDVVARTTGAADTHSRIVKIIKLPIDEHRIDVPDAIGDELPGYSFYRRDFDGNPMELPPPHGAELGAEFNVMLNKVAHDIRRLLQRLDAVAEPSGLNVYLAGSSADAATARARIRTELQQFGHRVLPAKDGIDEFGDAERIRSNLHESRLSVHVIGATHDPCIDLQYRLAGEEALARPEFRRLAWIDSGLQANGKDQIAFVESLRSDPDVRISSLETFKTLIQDALTRTPEHVHAGEGELVYLVFDAPDEHATKPIEDWLDKEGFKVWIPMSRASHRHYLKNSHGILIYWGKASKEWLAEKLTDLDKYKVPKLGAALAPLRGLMPADPAENKDRYPRRAVDMVLPGYGAFHPEMLEEFIRKLKGHEGDAV